MCWSARQTARARAQARVGAVRARGMCQSFSGAPGGGGIMGRIVGRGSGIGRLVGGWKGSILDGRREVIMGKFIAVGLPSYSAHIPHIWSFYSSRTSLMRLSISSFRYGFKETCIP
ncbi:MAG: hypothetical protein PHQ34_05660 [Methanothrix sp.]|nr:hypothetical protein [Methanothrix sp.]